MSPRRQHVSSALEIEHVDKVDVQDLSITVTYAGSWKPVTYQLAVPSSPAALQLLDAIDRSIQISPRRDPDAGWTSNSTLQQGVWQASAMLMALADAGIHDLASEAVGITALRAAYAPIVGSARRNACYLLARAVRHHHPGKSTMAHMLRNTSFATATGQSKPYEIEVAADIESAARTVWVDAYGAQRSLFERLGSDVKGRDWLARPAEDIVEWARNTHPEMAGLHVEPPSATGYAEKVAWAITHPQWFGYVPYARGPQVRDRQMRTIGAALYPDHVTLVSALIVHCLGEYAGFNLTVLLEKSAESLTYLGEDVALERSVKARNDSQDPRPTRLDSIFTPGGVVEVLTGLTRFSRLHRRTEASGERGKSVSRSADEADQSQRPLLSRLYVEHTARLRDVKLLDDNRMHQAWRSRRFDDAWAKTDSPIKKPGLRLGSLRYEAQRRAMSEGLNADVHGHSEQTRTHYLANVLPDYTLTSAATNAQDDFHDDAVAAFTPIAQATQGPAKALADTDPAELLDLEVNVCANGGREPDTDRRCTLGIAACFICPCGYRTADHIPGLLAAVEFAHLVEENDPTEWAEGEASDLGFYAKACLDEFPAPVVRNVKQTIDLTPHILTVTGLYVEMRHG